ncbi:metal ABC transporter solute-binding protein, Zn/Mn family [uncultured Microbacterium sp.]|uniref:metal ABC transporter solute-binding protein, Zn/Mn family n=1 Tax=uncultured Microbacterium sp. TaxID=191216 RepID=UPI0028D83504|nr:zinc ABC transporter substrate-binding protein [uncultured Microbacterium sp.]
MTWFSRRMSVLAVTAVVALALAGCASAGTDAPASDDGRLRVVASTNVYAQIAEEIGGDLVDVTAIVSSAAQDPHSFEATAKDQLTVSKADLVIENGGGYDAFVDALIDSSGSEAPVVTAVEFSEHWPENDTDDAHAGDDADDHAHVEGFNEHVFYDPRTVEHVAEAIADELAALQPADADTFRANADAFAAGVAGLENELGGIDADHAGQQVFVTEPVPVYLILAAGLQNATPEAFSEAVEEGQDVPPATLLESLNLLRDEDISVVVTNAQTGGAETTQITDEADGLGIPVIAFSETLPEGQTYLSWMQANIAALAGALAP